MIKTTLENLIHLIETDKVKVVDSPLYSVDFLKGVLHFAKKYEATFFGNYLHVPFYVSKTSGLVYCTMYADENYQLEYAFSTFMCTFHLPEDVTHLIPADISKISEIENSKTDFAPFTYTSVRDSTTENKTLTVNSPVVSLTNHTPETIIDSVPCKRKRNKLRSVVDSFRHHVTHNVHGVSGHTSTVLEWLFTRRGFTGDPIDFCVAMEAYLAVEIIKYVCEKNPSFPLRAYLLKHTNEELNTGESINHPVSCYSYLVVDVKRNTSIYMGMAQNPRFKLDNLGLYVLLEQAKFSLSKSIQVYDPTCVTQPFSPQSIDVYKRGLYNTHRDVNTLLITHEEDTSGLYPPYYHFKTNSWVTDGYDPQVSMSNFK